MTLFRLFLIKTFIICAVWGCERGDDLSRKDLLEIGQKEIRASDFQFNYTYSIIDEAQEIESDAAMDVEIAFTVLIQSQGIKPDVLVEYLDHLQNLKVLKYNYGNKPDIIHLEFLNSALSDYILDSPNGKSERLLQFPIFYLDNIRIKNDFIDKSVANCGYRIEIDAEVIPKNEWASKYIKERKTRPMFVCLYRWDEIFRITKVKIGDLL